MTWRNSRRAYSNGRRGDDRIHRRRGGAGQIIGHRPALVFIPHPVQDRTDDELRALADEHFDAIVKLLVK